MELNESIQLLPPRLGRNASNLLIVRKMHGWLSENEATHITFAVFKGDQGYEMDSFDLQDAAVKNVAGHVVSVLLSSLESKNVDLSRELEQMLLQFKKAGGEDHDY